MKGWWDSVWTGETDEKSLMVYLQKFSDDALLAALVPRLSPTESQDLFE